MDLKNLIPTHILQQIMMPLDENVKSTAIIHVKCGCGTIVKMTVRNLYRKWSSKQEYLCKSCHVKTYINENVRVSRFKTSISITKQSVEYKEERSKAGKKAWDDPATAERIKAYISQDNIHNPLKILARQKASAALRGKPWYSRHMQNMRSLANNKTKSNIDAFILKSRIIHGAKYNYDLVSYFNNLTKVKIVCPKHGEFLQTPHSHLQGKGCRRCHTTISNEHQKVIDLLPTEIDFTINDHSVIAPYELDIYIPQFRVGIEINGEYWHGINKSHNTSERLSLKYKHSHKASLAQNNGIRLLQFWTHEINNDTELIRSIIHHCLHRSNKLYARKCDIANIDFKEFFSRNHLQRYRSASYSIALIHEGEPVAALSLSKHPLYQWEIIRYASKMYHTVIGGFQKLLNRFISDESPTTIMTFADRRISQNNLYHKSGFKLIKITDPNYFYAKSNHILSRRQCQKSKLINIVTNYNRNLSETDNMLNDNFSKVYDAGHYQSVLSINKPTINTTSAKVNP
jgi:very-short-patch-repair endonuclease